MLELRFDPAEHEQARGEARATRRPSAWRCSPTGSCSTSDDGDAALAAVRGLGLEPLTSLVRRSTLEDVFLRLTGRRLED